MGLMIIKNNKNRLIDIVILNLYEDKKKETFKIELYVSSLGKKVTDCTREEKKRKRKKEKEAH
jgi:tmRNA-binding protein